jgi:hypothetical protein
MSPAGRRIKSRSRVPQQQQATQQSAETLNIDVSDEDDDDPPTREKVPPRQPPLSDLATGDPLCSQPNPTRSNTAAHDINYFFVRGDEKTYCRVCQ